MDVSVVSIEWDLSSFSEIEAEVWHQSLPTESIVTVFFDEMDASVSLEVVVGEELTSVHGVYPSSFTIAYN